MEQLSLQLINEARGTTRLKEPVIRGVTTATNTLCQWASDPRVPESVAAPRVLEAVRSLGTIVHRMRQMRAPAISKGSQQALLEAYAALRSFLSDEEDDDATEGGDGKTGPHGISCSAAAVTTTSANSLLPPSEREAAARQGRAFPMSDHARRSKSSLARERATALRRSMPAEEAAATAIRGSVFMLGLTCGSLLILVIFTLAVTLVGSHEFAQRTEEWERQHTNDLLSIAIDALDALYPAVAAETDDIRQVGLEVAAKLLAELSTTRAIGKYSTDKTVFLSPGTHLYEFRAGVQDFESQERRVTSVVTPRHYAALCRMNQSYPLEDLSDAGWPVKVFIIPQLTPQLCENDAGAQGVFMNVQPPYQSYAPYVRTYRRNGARLANFHHAAFDITVAVTVDIAPIQNLLVPRSTLFGAQSAYTFYNDTMGWWRRTLLVRLLLTLVVAGAGLALIGQLFTLPRLQFHGHRAVLAFCLALFSVAVMAASVLFTIGAIQAATQQALVHRTESLARCLASGFTSTALSEHGDAKVAFIRNAISGALAGRVLFLAGGLPDAMPEEMQPVADAIGAAKLTRYTQAITTGVAGGYCFADYAQPGESRHIIVVDQAEKYKVRMPALTGLAAGAVVAVFTLSMAVLYASPLRHIPLLFADGSLVFTHKLTPHRLRQLYYAFLCVVVITTIVGVNCYGTVLLQEAMTNQAKETLQAIAAAIRSPKLIDVCSASCGFPSTLVGLDFHRRKDSYTEFISASVPLPYYGVANWTNHYLGAQLATSQVPIALERAVSYSTPLMNETSKTIHANRIVRNLLVAVDINHTNGFTVERLNEPYGAAGVDYITTAHTIGFAVAGIGLCLAFSLMEWLYTRLLLTDPRHAVALRRPGEVPRPASRSSRVVHYALFVFISSVLLASLVVVSTGILRGRIQASMSLFTDSELSMAAASVTERLETLGIADDRYRTRSARTNTATATTTTTSTTTTNTTTSTAPTTAAAAASAWTAEHAGDLRGVGSEDTARTMAKLAAAIAEMDDGVRSSAGLYARWRLLQEWPAFGSNRVRVIAGPDDLAHDSDPAYVPELYSFGRLDFGAVSVCGSVAGDGLIPGVPERKRYCYAEIPGGSTVDTEIRPRAFAMVVRLEREVITEPAESAWRTLMYTSVGACLAVLLLFALATWWFLSASRFHAYAVFTGMDLLTVRGPIPRSYQAIDMYVPRRYRSRWAVTTAFGLVAALVFFTVSTSFAMHTLLDIRSSGIPSVTQEDLILGVTQATLMDGYDYMLAAQARSISAMQDRTNAVQLNTAIYDFVSDTWRDAVRGEMASLQSVLTALTELDAVRTSELVADGWDSYQSLLADTYGEFVRHQQRAMTYCQGLTENVIMFFTSGEASVDGQEIVANASRRMLYVNLLHAIGELRDGLRQLFILDHVVISSYLVLGSANGASAADNAYWPFGDAASGNTSLADARVKTIVAIAWHTLLSIADAANRVRAGSDVIFADTTSLHTVATETLANLYAEMPRAATLFTVVVRSDPSLLGNGLTANVAEWDLMNPPLWKHQRARAREVNYIHNFTAQAAAEAASRRGLAALSATDDNFVAPVTSEITVRKSAQLDDDLRGHIPLSTMQSRLRWECCMTVVQVEQWARVVVICTCVFYGVWIAASAWWFAITRERVAWWLTGATQRGVRHPLTDAERIPLVHGAGGADRALGSTCVPAPRGGSGTAARGEVEENEHEVLGEVCGVGKVVRSRSSAASLHQASSRSRTLTEASSGFWFALLHRYRHEHVLKIFLVVSSLALVPAGVNYWLLQHALTSTRDPNGALSMGLRAVVYQLELEDSCTNLLFHSARSYSTNSLLSLTHAARTMMDQALRMSYTYMWRLRPLPLPMNGPSSGTRAVSAEVASFLELAERVKRTVQLEVLLFRNRVPAAQYKDLSRGLSAYARAILEELEVVAVEHPDPTDPALPPTVETVFRYEAVMPLATSSGSSALHTHADTVYQHYRTAAQSATTVAQLGALVTAYRTALQGLEGITEAEWAAWNVAVLAARSNGGVVALTPGGRMSALVGDPALDALNDGSTTAAAAVAEAKAYFAKVVPLLADEATISTTFTTLGLDAMPGDDAAGRNLAGAITAAAVTSNHLSTIITEPTFRHVFAFNRGHVALSDHSILRDATLTQQLMSLVDSDEGVADAVAAALAECAARRLHEASMSAPRDVGGVASSRSANASATSLVESVGELVAASRALVQTGVAGVDHYATRPAESNPWTWKEEIYPVPTVKSLYTQIPFLRRCQSWCSICAIWIAAVAVVYIVFAMELAS